MAQYHVGERTVQARAGMAEQAAFSLGAIGAEIPQVARDFLATQPVLFLGAGDQSGHLWTTVLSSPPGFVRAVSSRQLTVEATPPEHDPLAAVLARSEVEVGMLALEPATRRRMRLNGTSHPTETGIRVDLEQVYANCPKYIAARSPRPDARTAPRSAPRRTTSLTAAQRDLVAAADFFVVSTSSADGAVDASHRGGRPGFVQVVDETRLRWPDYVGNAMFMTLGNLQENRETGLLFLDWKTGAGLQISGTASVLWDAADFVDMPGAQRAVDFHVRTVHATSGLLPHPWTDPVPSRTSP
ncbi:pyridoxamine 5'-phosphate oxidase family protein [Mumia quercus]|uniref:pyridoxamine 5'-phosphate oxidase family protein n=1 Tax=Mumia quercus TaxID=2976125 RepID=UPI0021D1561C|nr:pyridoxamine 5'-phosphate oxidase family protein [Mumia quercus]